VEEEIAQGASFNLDAFVNSFTLSLDDLLAELIDATTRSSDADNIRDFAEKAATALKEHNTLI